MCGIAGIFDLPRARRGRPRLLRRMTDHRCIAVPTATGFIYAPGIGLGHRRLAIIDLAGGDQPMFNEDRTVCVVFNGEIYNFQPLMAELAALGHRLPHALRHRGHRPCLGGMGRGLPRPLQRACSPSPCGTRAAETLFLARDRLGEKPLYYGFLADGRLLFASELKSLLC